MSAFVVALVLGAAILHAGWNALLKSGADRLRAMTVMCLAAALAALPAILLLPLPHPASWPYVAASAVLQIAYNVFLVRAYQYGDLGQVYPIARGVSPLLVTLGGAAFAAEQPGGWTIAGIALISLGIVSLARGWGGGRRWGVNRGLGIAVATGCFIAAYTVVDALGGRLSGEPRAYAAWLFFLDGPLMLLAYRGLRGREAPVLAFDRATLKGAAGGIVSLLAYGSVVWAAAIAPMGAVSALRETSVVFAALIGWLVLGERFSLRRLVSCGVVAAGAVMLA
jgi:drug/metabolite transporter (DMT)-like permease